MKKFISTIVVASLLFAASCTKDAGSTATANDGRCGTITELKKRWAIVYPGAVVFTDQPTSTLGYVTVTVLFKYNSAYIPDRFETFDMGGEEFNKKPLKEGGQYCK